VTISTLTQSEGARERRSHRESVGAEGESVMKALSRDGDS
jgi:hypothetical protein